MKNFLFLVSAKEQAQPTLSLIGCNVKKIDPHSSAWIDASNAVFFMASDLPARELWALAFQDLADHATTALRDALVLEIGSDYAANSEAKYAAWLNSHGVHPRIW